MFGLPNNLSYATAKAAVVGMTRSLTTAGAAHDIKVNLIAPAALAITSMAEGSTKARRSGAPKAGILAGRWRSWLLALLLSGGVILAALHWGDAVAVVVALALFVAGRWVFLRLSPHFEDFV